jgi:hypothetical protein
VFEAGERGQRILVVVLVSLHLYGIGQNSVVEAEVMPDSIRQLPVFTYGQ